jgi:phosphocarrier protein FPr
MAGSYRSLGDETLRARAMDVLDVGDQVILNLLGQGRQAPVMAGAGILVAPDLSPAETAGLDPSKVLGICTALGGPTSHSAILARTFGIPALVGLGEGILDLPEGCCLIVDAENGWLIPDPDEPTRLDYARRAEAMGRDAERLRLDSAAKAVTTDGRSVAIGANVGSLAQALAAVASGAEGVGLLRTEFLYLDRTTAPDEEEQFQAYQGIAAAMGGRPVIIRTLDIGGDKPLPYIDQGHEANPYLGARALRLCLARPELFKVQLRAILRVAAAHPVKVMFPMVATLGELRAARALVAEARAELEQRGEAMPDRLELGIMVEIPAAALLADVLAPEVDFFSIGTNDLTQYTLAAERGNPAVAALGDALHPAVLQLIQRVAEAAHRHGKWVGVCGELGGDPLAAAILLGLGIDELSMSAPAIPKIKALIRRLDAAGAERLARSVLGLAMAGEVRTAVRTELLAQGLVV